ncbi:MAG: flagellar hook-length control protein FliK [Rhodobacteraceae bacterium]|nr:flagellar hook-length control protein FliK [Paracoccaceae bacterium]
MPATPAMTPLFASPGGTAREGTGDAAFVGADLAALDTGRAQSGAFLAATAVPAEPRAIVRQIADAMIAAHENGIDLQLSPEELGRVRLSITPGEGGFLVTVSADRPETLELLRRHIDLLGEEFAALGLGDTAFSFNDPPGHPAQDDEHRSQTDATLVGLGETAEPETPVPPAPHPRAQSGLLDIRL